MTVSKEEEVTVKFPGFCFQKLKPRLTTPDTWKGLADTEMGGVHWVGLW